MKPKLEVPHGLLLEVTLRVRVWIETIWSQKCKVELPVTLRVRVWIETCDAVSFRTDVYVTLRVRVWIETFAKSPYCP